MKRFLIIMMLVLATSAFAATPNPGHDASRIGAGTFSSGNYTFPANLNVTGNLLVDTNTLSVDAAANRVGIGQASPLANLHINSTGNTEIRLDYPSNLFGRLHFGGDGVIIVNGATASEPYLMHMSTTGNIKLSPGNIDTLFLNASNRYVGIGTANPTHQLHVVGSANITSVTYTPQLCLNGDCRTSWPSTTANATGAGTTNYVARFLNTTHITTGLIFDNGTHVGVGTTTPVQRLEVNGGRLRINDTGSGVLELTSNNANKTNYLFTDGTTGDLYIRTDSTAYDLILQTKAGLDVGNVGVGTSAPVATLDVNSSNAAGSFKVQNTSSSLHFFVNGSSGRIGLGTAEPATQLHVYHPTTSATIRVQSNSSSQFSAMNDVNTSLRLVTFSNTNGGSLAGVPIANWSALDYTGSGMIIGTVSAGAPLVFEQASTEIIRLTGGNVGIGTTEPVAKLQVTGTFNVSSNAYVQGDIYLGNGGFNDRVNYDTSAGVYQFFRDGNTAAGIRVESLLVGSSYSASVPTNGANISGLIVGGNGLTITSGTITLPNNQIDSAEVSFNYAGSASKGGAATTATALAANPANCGAGQWAAGIDASGAAEGCTADDDNPDSDAEVPDAITVSGGTLGSNTIASGATLTLTDSFFITKATGPTNLTFTAGNYGSNRATLALDSAALGITVGSGSTPAMYILHSNSNVGVGTTDPTTRLQVQGGHISMYHALDSQSAGYYLQGFTDGGSAKTNKAQIGLLQDLTGSRAGRIIFDVANSSGGLNTVMTINGTSGRVGIGTASANDMLHVKGAGRSLGGNNILATFESTGGNATINIAHSANGGQIGYANYGATNNLFFITTGAGTIGSGIVMDNTGKVGIGQSSPDKLLTLTQNAANATMSFSSSADTAGHSYGVIESKYSSAYNPSAQIKFVRPDVTWGTEGEIHFYTNPGTSSSSAPVQAMAITKAGKVGIGTPTPSEALEIVSSAANTPRIRLNNTGNNNYAGIEAFQNNIRVFQLMAEGGTESTYLDSRGALYIRTQALGGSSGGLYTTNLGTGTGMNYLCYDTSTGQILRGNGAACTASSLRFKEDVDEIEYGLAAIRQLRPVSYEFKPESNIGEGTKLGFIAEEMYQVIPEVVTLDDNNQPYGLDYPVLTAVLAKSVQELDANDRAIEARVAALESPGNSENAPGRIREEGSDVVIMLGGTQ